MKQIDNVTMQDIVLSLIEDIIYKGGKNNYVVFSLDKYYYIKIKSVQGTHEVYCEAVGDFYLEGQLSKEQKGKLKRLNWKSPNRKWGNYYLIHKVDSEKQREQLANLISYTAKLVYKCKELVWNDIDLYLDD